MLSSHETEKCPGCDKALVKGQQAVVPASFCENCRFPLMKLAGKYRMLKLIGEGTFGRVYLAKHIHLQRNAYRIIQVLKQSWLDNPVIENRFLREIQLTSELSQYNNHIVRIYDDFGPSEEMGFYYVMEFLEGKVLADSLLDAQELPEISWCIEVVLQICKGIRAAHDAGIVHRDLKP